MANSFNISDLFSRAFGYQPPDEFSISKEQLEASVSKFNIPTASARKEVSGKGGKYYATDQLGREFFLPVTINGYLIPFAVISINCSKTIISTALPERGGNVIELVSIDSYKINIKGMCVSDDNSYPETDIQKLFDLFAINKSVIVRSVLTAMFLDGDHDEKCVIRDMKFPALAGVENAKPFELELESDRIFDLKVK